MTDLMESVAGSLQQRIGQLVSQYEVDMAVVKSQAAQQLEAKDAEIKALKEQLEAALAEKEQNVPEEEAVAEPKTRRSAGSSAA